MFFKFKLIVICLTYSLFNRNFLIKVSYNQNRCVNFNNTYWLNFDQ